MSKRVFAFHYKLTNGAGELIDQSEAGEPIHFLEGSGQIIPGLESKLLNLKTGDKRDIKVIAAEAYGERDEKLVVKVPRDQLPSPEVKVGDMFRGGPDEDAPVFTVTAVNLSEVTVDANHPLAGEDLMFAIEMGEIRNATADEMSHGHAHGPGGHHH